MKKDYTHITMVIDRSGSMESIKRDAEGGVNSFIGDQQKLEGECTFTLAQFDTSHNIVYNFVNLKEVKPYSLIPRGGTALLDAIGTQINTLGAKLDSLSDEEKPEKVIFIIVTDGEENSSTEFTRDQILKMITHQEETYKWEFVFMAANQDAIQAGASLGVKFDKSMTFVASGIGTTNAFSSLSSNAAAYRSGADATYNFKSDDRLKQEQSN